MIQFSINPNYKNTFDRIIKLVHRYVLRSQNKAAKNIAENVKEAFLLQGARGNHWEWEPTTEIARQKRIVGKNNGLTLVDTGKLMNSIAGIVSQVDTKTTVVIDSDVNYAHQHNDGPSTYTVDGKTYDVPHREFLFLTSDDRDEVFAIFGDESIV